MHEFMLYKRLSADEKATTALEFALVAPILFILIFAILEITGVMLASAVLESAVRVASRAGITGYTPAGMTRDAYVQQVVRDNLQYLNSGNLQFQTLVYDSYSNIGQPEPYTDSNHNGVYNVGEPYTDVNANGQWDLDMGASGSGGAGAIVVYKVTYPWRIITPLLSRFFSSNGQFDITASMVVRNEPYD
jgi:hypothetical protein